MTRTRYIFCLIFGCVIVGLAPKLFHGAQREAISTWGMYWLIIVVIPTLSIMRMRTLGMTWKEMLLSLIPFYGAQYRYRRFTEK